MKVNVSSILFVGHAKLFSLPVTKMVEQVVSLSEGASMNNEGSRSYGISDQPRPSSGTLDDDIVSLNTSLVLGKQDRSGEYRSLLSNDSI